MLHPRDRHRDHQRPGDRELARKNETDLFIAPGSSSAVLARATNFHLPKSSCWYWCVLSPDGAMLQAYRHAVLERYRFFSYGDCMLII